ncbi:MAG: LLM class F420-dependent oxidoreductase [Actinobacteria bacterium]|nr:LLM class F420-dependent oxidoreductase [Actinomycetota bacterium]
MHIGALIFPTDRAMRPDRLAVELERRGYESLWVAEHTHIPLSRKSPYPGGGELPEMYTRTMDPFVALTAAAVATTTLRVGTGICLVNQHHPINAAKQAASVDHLSGGRLLFGVGVGWNTDEMEHHGVDPSKRRSTARERVLAIRELWTAEEAEFHGEYVDFSPSLAYPKPVSSPHPPILMGGAGGPVTFRHVVEYCDGWIPIHGRSDPLENLPLLRSMAADAGRDPDSLDISIYGCPMDAEAVDRYRQAGVDRVIFWLPAIEEEALVPILERHQDLLAG